MLRNLILILFFISTTSVYAQDSLTTPVITKDSTYQIVRYFDNNSCNLKERYRAFTIDGYLPICYAYKIINSPSIKIKRKYIDTTRYKISPLSNDDSLIIAPIYKILSSDNYSILPNDTEVEDIKNIQVITDQDKVYDYFNEYVPSIFMIYFINENKFWKFIEVNN